ncbi:MAG: helix-turn-helix domain-containing protein [Gammaproteobacteria bacterium]
MTSKTASALASILRGEDPLWPDSDSEAYLDLKPGTLAVWRATKRYPIPYLKIGRNVRYRKSDLDRFLASRTFGGDTGEGA